jgi:hypothetical protein
MKYLLPLLVLGLMGCGDKASDANLKTVNDGLGAGIAAGCKTVYNSWVSDTDSEAHNFTTFNTNNPATFTYTFTSSDGAEVCGQPGARTTFTSEWNNESWSLEMIYTYPYDPAVSKCAYYRTSTNRRVQKLILQMETCNQLKVCRTSDNIADCKTFH